MAIAEILERLKDAENWSDITALIDDIEREKYLCPPEQKKKGRAA